MYKINDNYLKLPGSYLFSTIAKKVNAYTEANPDKKVIRLGIGDVTLPLAPAVIDAMHKAVDEMAHAETFHGYAPDLGYEFLRSAIVENDYKARGVDIAIDEIFVSDGAKSDSGNILLRSVRSRFPVFRRCSGFQANNRRNPRMSYCPASSTRYMVRLYRQIRYIRHLSIPRG